MADGAAPRTDHVEMATDPAAFVHWPPGLHDELLSHMDNGCVGSLLLSETDRVRVWHLEIPPGGRFPFHRHVSPYFWSSLTAGKARSYFADGRIVDTEYFKGETRHFHYGPDESMAHSLENIGDTPLAFTTVEFLDGLNPPLEVPASVRL